MSLESRETDKIWQSSFRDPTRLKDPCRNSMIPVSRDSSKVQMQNNRFVVLTGHLSNYPLSDLIGILRHQKKSGRLLIEYPKGPATLFFEDGELVDVRLNELAGLQSICVLVAQPDAAFNFNPLIRASQRSIDGSFQRVVSELFGCWDESALQIDGVSVKPVLQLNPYPADQNAPPPLEGRSVEPLALPPAPPISTLRQRSVLMAAAAVLLVIGISTVIAVTGSLKKSKWCRNNLLLLQTVLRNLCGQTNFRNLLLAQLTQPGFGRLATRDAKAG